MEAFHLKFPLLKILLLTLKPSVFNFQRLLKSGCSGIIHYSTGGFEIKNGIFNVMEGKNYICPVAAGEIIIKENRGKAEIKYGAVKLTWREERTLQCLLKRMTIKEMMAEFNRKASTIKESRGKTKRKIREAGYNSIYDFAEKMESGRARNEVSA